MVYCGAGRGRPNAEISTSTNLRVRSNKQEIYGWTGEHDGWETGCVLIEVLTKMEKEKQWAQRQQYIQIYGEQTKHDARAEGQEITGDRGDRGRQDRKDRTVRTNRKDGTADQIGRTEQRSIRKRPCPDAEAATR